MDLNDPAFPHGTNRGYQAGCHATNPCPATPTCTTAHRDHGKAWRQTRAQSATTEPGLPKKSHVLRRLDETIAVAGLDAVLARTGYSRHTLARIRAIPGTTLPWERAERLDQAWAYLVHGRDTLDPSFEHGRGVTSYTNWCCRCRVCTRANTRATKAARLGRTRPHARVHGPAARAVERHVRTLVRVGPTNAIARAAGIAEATVRKVLDGATINVPSAQALMGTTAAQVAACARTVDPANATHVLGTLNALGYSTPWISSQVGASAGNLSRILRGAATRIDPAVDRALTDLAARIGDKPATVEDGFPRNAISLAKRNAREYGFYPPAFYDDNRQLSVRSIADHPWARLDEAAASKVTALGLMARGLSQAEAGRRTGLNRKTVERMPHGLTYVHSTLSIKASWERIKEVERITLAWENGHIGPVTAAFMLGLLSVPHSKEQQEHPEVVAWVASRETDSAASDAA